MTNKIIFLSLFFLCLSCNSSRVDSITIFNDKNLLDHPFEVIVETYWGHKSINIDSLTINDSMLILELNEKLNDLSNSKEVKPDWFHPKYALVLNSKKEKDTIYFDEGFELAYFKRKEIKVFDDEGLLNQFMNFHFKSFLEKDYVEEKLKERKN